MPFVARISGNDTRLALRRDAPQEMIPAEGSYQGQDAFVIAVLNGLRGGFFLDSGASNGIRGSNSLRLERDYAWRGICIEPNHRFFAELVANRSCICLECCLWHRTEDVAFLEAAGVYGGIISAYDPAFKRFAISQAAECNGADPIDPVAKPARTIGSILAECGAPDVIDYWSLDTEGSELAILKSFPFERYRVRVLTVEHNYSTVREDIHLFLVSRDMMRVDTLGIDDVYMSIRDVERPAWRSRALRPR
jgi:Methyltransferase FkbM domain